MATTLKSMFGISIPTTDLPGDRGLDPDGPRGEGHRQVVGEPSMRLTFTDGSGSTSYWVTTGPAFHFTTRLGTLKLASLPTMIAALRSWSIPRRAAGRDVLEERQRRQAVLARLPRRRCIAAVGDIVDRLRDAGGSLGGSSASDGSAVAATAAACPAQRHAAAREDR